MTLNIYQDGKQIESKAIAPAPKEYLNLQPTLERGSRLDFDVTPGPGLNSSYDSTGLRATILTPNK